jgi:uncharacterized peroxidase-related enzyme
MMERMTDGIPSSTIGFLAVAATTPEAQQIFDEDISDLGYVMNVSRLWAYQPGVFNGLFDLMNTISTAHGLDVRQRGILVTAFASTFGDSVCSLAWGSKLADNTDPQLASGVLRGDDDRLTPKEQAMAAWARKVTQDPNGTTETDVKALRDAGFSDAEIFAITAFVALRVALSTVNDALGARPDAALRTSAPQAVLHAVTYGRPIDDDRGGEK